MIDVKEVEYIARLARLNLKPEEKEKFTQQLGSILMYFEKLKELDTKDVPPTFHVIPLTNVFREDKTFQSLRKEVSLRGAPEKEGSYFRVPKVIE